MSSKRTAPPTVMVLLEASIETVSKLLISISMPLVQLTYVMVAPWPPPVARKGILLDAARVT